MAFWRKRECGKDGDHIAKPRNGPILPYASPRREEIFSDEREAIFEERKARLREMRRYHDLCPRCLYHGECKPSWGCTNYDPWEEDDIGNLENEMTLNEFLEFVELWREYAERYDEESDASY